MLYDFKRNFVAFHPVSMSFCVVSKLERKQRIKLYVIHDFVTQCNENELCWTKGIKTREEECSMCTDTQVFWWMVCSVRYVNTLCTLCCRCQTQINFENDLDLWLFTVYSLFLVFYPKDTNKIYRFFFSFFFQIDWLSIKAHQNKVNVSMIRCNS